MSGLTLGAIMLACMPMVAPCTVSAIAPTSGSTAGGTHVVATVSSSLTATKLTVNGVDCTGFAIDDATHVSGNTVAAGAGGPYSVTVTNAGGVSAPLAAAYTFVAPFDPATFNLTWWFKAPFVSNPTQGASSAGISNTIYEKLHATSPTVGETLNGIAGADYLRSSSDDLKFNATLCDMDDLVTNTAFTYSILTRVGGGGVEGSGATYEAGHFIAADAHFGIGFSSDAACVHSTPGISFDGAAHTITRTTGSWITDGFTTGRTVYVSKSVSNNGQLPAPTNVTATVMTFAAGLVTEASSNNPRVIGGTSYVRVFFYTGAFPTVTRTITPGLHWIYVRHTSGFTQIDIDGVAGANQAHANHSGSYAGLAPQVNWSNYVATPLTYVKWDEFFSKSAQSDADRDNYKSYLNTTYGTAY